MTELTNVWASTAIGVRSEQHTSLPLPDFLDLFNHSWNFVLKCEVIRRRMIVDLRGVVVSQVRWTQHPPFVLPLLMQNRQSCSFKRSTKTEYPVR